MQKKGEKKEHYYRRRTRIAMPFLIITIITSRAVRSYDHVSRISYSGVSVKGSFSSLNWTEIGGLRLKLGK